MKITGIFRNYDDIDAAILQMSDIGIRARNVYVSGFSDTDFNAEFASELAFGDLKNHLNDRSDSGINDYNPMRNKIFAAGAALISATETTSTDLFSANAPDGGNFEAVSLNAFTGDEKFSGKRYNKYVAAVVCRDSSLASTVAERLRNSGAENVVITNA